MPRVPGRPADAPPGTEVPHALGDDVCKYETRSLVQLQGAEHVGIASALLATAKCPFMLLRSQRSVRSWPKTVTRMTERRDSQGARLVGDRGPIIRARR